MKDVVHIYDVSFISLSFIYLPQTYYELTKCPVPSWLDSSVGKGTAPVLQGQGFESHSRSHFGPFFFLFATAQVST